MLRRNIGHAPARSHRYQTMICKYSVIRFVPDGAKGEFVNVGLIIGSEESGDVIVKVIRNRNRATHLAKKKVVDSFFQQLEAYKTAISRLSVFREAGRFTYEWLTEQHNSARDFMRLSAPVPVSSDSVASAARLLAKELLDTSAPRKRKPRATKADTVKAIRRAYDEHGLKKGKEFFEHVVVEASQVHGRFDFGVKNGRIVQLTHAWNFSQQDVAAVIESVKAWAFVVERIRQAGGKAWLKDESIPVSKDVQLRVVHTKPKTSRQARSLDEAMYAFAEVEALVHYAEETAPIGESAAKLVN